MPLALAISVNLLLKLSRLIPAAVILSTNCPHEPCITLFTSVFRAVEILSITLPNTSVKLVQRTFASSKLPKISSKVSAQPEPADSLRVSHIMLNVLTSLAAANAFLPISVVSSAYRPRVATRTSVVIHCDDNESLNLEVASNASDTLPVASLVVEIYFPFCSTSVPISTAV